MRELLFDTKDLDKLLQTMEVLYTKGDSGSTYLSLDIEKIIPYQENVSLIFSEEVFIMYDVLLEDIKDRGFFVPQFLSNKLGIPLFIYDKIATSFHIYLPSQDSPARVDFDSGIWNSMWKFLFWDLSKYSLRGKAPFVTYHDSANFFNYSYLSLEHFGHKNRFLFSLYSNVEEYIERIQGLDDIMKIPEVGKQSVSLFIDREAKKIGVKTYIKDYPFFDITKNQLIAMNNIISNKTLKL